MNKISLLDCTLRDGAYIVDARFGVPAIKGIIKKLQDANVEIIECGWLKNQSHEQGTSYYHVPTDLESYLIDKNENCIYTVMIDWDRYNLGNLPVCDHKSVDAIRVVFPHGKVKEGVAIGREILKKGYKVFVQAANTLAYSDDDLVELAREVNASGIETVSIVDTFGAMYHEDLERIMYILDKHLNPDIAMGFHSHNNQQLSFALSIHFIEWMKKNTNRGSIVDASLCGMGRGAGNATTELVANYLIKTCVANYDMNYIMDAIDTYMQKFQEEYTWGYSTPYFIAGMYGCHVNNIAYLIQNHRTNAKDMRNIIQSLSADERTIYDYDILEQKYIENQDSMIDDFAAVGQLHEEFTNRDILLIAPGVSSLTLHDKVQAYIDANNPVIIHVNAVVEGYKADYLFFANSIRYEYAKNTYPDMFENTDKILLSSVKHVGKEDEKIIRFSSAVKTKWKHFDNAVICCLRVLNRIGVEHIVISGFDEFKKEVNANYADQSLPIMEATMDYRDLNKEITEMYRDFYITRKDNITVDFITPSIFDLSDME